MSAEIQFSTNLNDDSATPVFNRGAAFVFKFQAVTSESESKVRVFLPCPKLPKSKLTEACSLFAHRGHSDVLAEMNAVKRYENAVAEVAHLPLFDRIDEQLKKLDKEITGAQGNWNRLVEIASSFLPQQPTLGVKKVGEAHELSD